MAAGGGVHVRRAPAAGLFGQVADEQGELFVAVSARTGEVAFAKHPSAVRAMATKLRKFLSFDRR